MVEVDMAVVGRVWDWDAPHVTLCNMESYARGLRMEGVDRVNYFHWEKDTPTAPNLVIFPGFNILGGRYVARTKALLLDAKLRGAKVVLFTGDIEVLPIYSGFVKELGLVHGLCTSFQRPWRLWHATYQFHDYHAYYATDMLVRKGMDAQPKYPCGYVGWPKPKRMRVLKRIGYRSMPLLGPGTDKQDFFPYAMADANTPFPYLYELYSKVAWTVCVSDPAINEVRPSVSRHLESWELGRPCLFHTSMVESRPDVPWHLVEADVFETADQLHEKSRRHMNAEGTYDLEKLAMHATWQKSQLFSHYFHAAPQARQAARWFCGLDTYPKEK